ncbi:SDR family NAD(P)-dependent oxidoreductase [Pseudomonas entomophila]|uniref:SDR family NAD(P)-dependent oxidoreductase n=1 Tax=Pseudomonas entomophila TaxID=312306 RepID=UPI0015E39395|nr:SDR family NAD(P)-dependent oxidoreductase [Pseudomonas entomophila]MBA1193094.1 SDR family NAD(P)-dependent oxidoreductase [Pseudomonas entomophila]
MPTTQAPLHTPFHARSTADEVLAGQALSGLHAVITGGHSGLGRETTRALSRAGARVTVLARDIDAARDQLGALPDVSIVRLDLSDLDSVQASARHLLAQAQPIDVLIGNAGIMASPLFRTAQGWEGQFATNHLGHYALVNRLWPALRKGARVVMVSSAGHHASGMRWHDIHFTQGYDKWLAYGQSKTANALFAVHLDHLGRRHGVRAFAVHPGKILTPLQRHLAREEMRAAGWVDANGELADPTFKTVQQGAATQVWTATSPALQGRGGVYCEDGDIASLETSEPPSWRGVRPHAVDPEQAARLWTLSAQLTGLDAFAPG